MPSFEESIGVFEEMTNVFEDINACFENVTRSAENFINAVNSFKPHINLQVEATLAVNEAAEIAQSQVNSVTEEAAKSQKLYNSGLMEGSTLSGELLGNIKGISNIYNKFSKIKEIFDMSDTYTRAAEEFERVFNTADSSAIRSGVMAAANNSGVSYTSMQESVLSLGQSGLGANEAVAFAELANKGYAAAGLSGDDQKGAVSQLVSAMSAGDVQASVEALSLSPELYSSLENYVSGINTAGMSMEEMAAKGLISMDTIGAAVLGSSESINNSFSQMPMTWGSIWNTMGNLALRALTPVFGVLSFLANNISIILPLVIGLGTAFAVFKVAANWTKILTKVMDLHKIMVGFTSTAYKFLSGQITFANAVQKLFNKSMLACPIAWIIVGIIAIIAVIFALVAVINKVTGSTLSVAGIIMGAVFTVGAFILNIIISIWNAFAVVADFFTNVFKNAVAFVEILFRSLAINVLEFISNMVKGIEDLINKIPGVEIDITSGVNNTLEKMRNDLANLKSEADWEDYTQTFDYVDYGKAFENGYNFGEGLGDSFKGLFSGNELEMPNPDDFNFGDYAGGIQDYAGGVQNYGGSGYGGAAYTGGMPRGMMSQAAGSEANMSQTSQKQLLRAAQGGSLAKTTAITINMNNENRINSELDVDGVVDYLARATADAMAGMAEGV